MDRRAFVKLSVLAAGSALVPLTVAESQGRKYVIESFRSARTLIPVYAADSPLASLDPDHAARQLYQGLLGRDPSRAWIKRNRDHDYVTLATRLSRQEAFRHAVPYGIETVTPLPNNPLSEPHITVALTRAAQIQRLWLAFYDRLPDQLALGSTVAYLANRADHVRRISFQTSTAHAEGMEYGPPTIDSVIQDLATTIAIANATNSSPLADIVIALAVAHGIVGACAAIEGGAFASITGIGVIQAGFAAGSIAIGVTTTAVGLIVFVTGLAAIGIGIVTIGFLLNLALRPQYFEVEPSQPSQVPQSNVPTLQQTLELSVVPTPPEVTGPPDAPDADDGGEGDAGDSDGGW